MGFPWGTPEWTARTQLRQGLTFPEVSAGLSLPAHPQLQPWGPRDPPAPGRLAASPAGRLRQPARQRQAPGGYQRAQGAEARRGRALPPSPSPRSPPAGCWGQRGSAAHRRPRGACDGAGGGGGRAHGLEPTAHFKRPWGRAPSRAPGTSKRRALPRPPRCALGPRSPGAAAGGHDPRARRRAPPGSPAARRGRARRRYDGAGRGRSAGGRRGWSRCSGQTDPQRGGMGSACWSEGTPLGRAQRGHLT